MRVPLEISQLTVDKRVSVLSTDGEQNNTDVWVSLEDLSNHEFDELMVEHLNHYYAMVERKNPFIIEDKS